MNDPGPQKSPKSVHAVQAEAKQTSRLLAAGIRFVPIPDGRGGYQGVADIKTGNNWFVGMPKTGLTDSEK